MIILKYDGYLEEQKMTEMIRRLCRLSTKFHFIGTQFCFPERKRLKYDVAFQYQEIVYVVEYDGYQHYTNYERIYNDTLKNELASQHGFRLVRIPNFVQLTTETFKLYFPDIREDIVIEQNFPHGFIAQINFYPPAAFCKLGYERYQKEFKELPKHIQKEIHQSLVQKAEEKNIPIEFVE